MAPFKCDRNNGYADAQNQHGNTRSMKKTRQYAPKGTEHCFSTGLQRKGDDKMLAKSKGMIMKIPGEVPY